MGAGGERRDAQFRKIDGQLARYLHRIYKWVDKVGLDWCREQVADPATRAALYGRFMLSQSVYQADPWAEHAAAPAAWQPVADLTLRAAE